MTPLSAAEEEYFRAERSAPERLYQASDDPRRQSGFGRDERDWERYRRPVAEAIDHLEARAGGVRTFA